jgi:flagellin-like protein
MSKAVSSVIATLLMLVITISLVGLVWSFISGIFTSRTATTFSVVDVYRDTITIINDGTASITSFSSVTVDGNPATYLVVSQDTSLFGYWNFDEGIGTTAADSSGKGNNGKFSGETFNDGTLGSTPNSDDNDPSRVGGKYGKALSFNGVNNYVTIPDSTNLRLKQSWTLETWAYWKTTGINQQFIHKDNTYLLGYVWNNIEVSFHDGSNWQSLYTTSPPSSNTWHHIAGTFDGTYLKVYVDGVLNNTKGPLTTSPTIANGAVYLGYLNPSGTRWLNGTLDEVRIYNRSLTQAEIQADMQSSMPITPPVASYSFEESGQYVNDSHIWIKGKFGNALNFDGSDDYVNVGNYSVLNSRTNDFSISAWFKTNGKVDNWYTDWQHLIYYKDTNNMGDRGLLFGIGGKQTAVGWSGWPGQVVCFVLGECTSYCMSLASTSRYDDGNWHYAVCSIDRDRNGVLYVDGQQVATIDVSPWSGHDYNSIYNANIGTDAWQYERFNGTIDEVQLWNRSLSADEVQLEYKMGGIINPGQIATIKFYPSTPLSTGTHIVRLCTSSMCQPAYLMIV